MGNKFKIGDEVVCVDREEDCWYEVGDRLIISSEGFKPNGDSTVYNIEGEPSRRVWIVEAHFELYKDEWGTSSDKTAGTKKHNHYFKDCPYDKIDVYRILDLWKVSDPCLQHLVKKALCAGERGHKGFRRDLQDIIDTAQRRIDMLDEEESLNE